MRASRSSYRGRTIHVWVIKCQLYGMSGWANNATNGIAKIIRHTVIGLIFPRIWKAAKMQATRNWVVCAYAFDAFNGDSRRVASPEHHATRTMREVCCRIAMKGSYSRRNWYGTNEKARNNVDAILLARPPRRTLAAPNWNAQFSMFIGDARKMRFS